MIVDFSKIDYKEPPVLVLKTLDGTAIQTLGFAMNVEPELSYNELSSLSFDIPAYADEMAVPHYDDVVGMRIVDLVGVGQFLLIDPSEDGDGIKRIKSCKAYSLEYEFAKKDIYLEAGTYNFYDGISVSNQDTIIGRIKERMPDWSFVVDTSLIGKYRTFDDTNKKVYEFIKSDLQESYSCIFDFDTYTRTVYIKSVNSNVATKAVYLAEDQLIKKIKIDEDSDSIVTCLDVNGAEDVTIRSVNPTGTNKIYNLDYFLNETNFSQSFITKWKRWKSDFTSKQSEYYDITIAYNMKLLEIAMEESAVNDKKANITSKENQVASYIQLQATATTSATKAQMEALIAERRAEINSIQSEIDSISKRIDDLKAERDALQSCREAINYSLAFSQYFTAAEISILKRYFIEDTLQDSSFVAQTAATYKQVDSHSAFSNMVISMENATIQASPEDNPTVYSITGGTVSIETMSATIIKATLRLEKHTGSSDSLLFTAYVSKGTIGNSTFNSGNITVSGTLSRMSMDQTASINVTDGRWYFTENVTEYEQGQIEFELYEYGKQVLEEHASPTYNFSVESANFIALDDFALFKEQLSLGQRVYLSLNGKVYEPYVVSIRFKYDDPSSFSIDFSSSFTAFDSSFALSKLLEQSISMGKTVSYKNNMYSSFVNSGASTSVYEFMNSALDIAKNNVLSSGDQAISIDDTGIRVRKWANESKTGFDPEEIRIVENMIAFTDDGWQTAKMAIGKIFDPNIVSSTNPDGIAYGIVAPYLVGTMIAGENLVIESSKKDGGTSVFRVDGSGASLYNAKFTLYNGTNTILLDPVLGIGIGTGSSIVTVDEDTGAEEWDTSVTKFWVDTQGNLHFKGNLEGASGTFSGALNAATGSFTGDVTANNLILNGTLKDKNNKDMLDGLKIKSDYLDVKGITVTNNGQTTFHVDENGNVTIKGDLTGSNGTFTGELSGSSFYDDKKQGVLKLSSEIGSGAQYLADMTFSRYNQNGDSTKELFKVHDGIGDTIISINGHEVLTEYNPDPNSNAAVVNAHGTWDFTGQDCTILIPGGSGGQLTGDSLTLTKELANTTYKATISISENSGGYRALRFNAGTTFDGTDTLTEFLAYNFDQSDPTTGGAWIKGNWHVDDNATIEGLVLYFS